MCTIARNARRQHELRQWETTQEIKIADFASMCNQWSQRAGRFTNCWWYAKQGFLYLLKSIACYANPLYLFTLRYIYLSKATDQEHDAQSILFYFTMFAGVCAIRACRISYIRVLPIRVQCLLGWMLCSAWTNCGNHDRWCWSAGRRCGM